jgi:hypothetical protein
MARISVYQADNNITANDKVIGTDFSGTTTKNFPLRGIADLYNKGYVLVGGQSGYKFSDLVLPGTLTGPSNNTQFSNIVSIRLSSIDAAEQSIPNFILEYKNQKIVLFDNNEKNNYGIYLVTNVVEDQAYAGYFLFTLNNITSHGALILDNFYSIGMIGQDGDRSYRHDQPVAAETWSITHNMRKFPSVSVALSTGHVGYGDVIYIDENNLTVSFSGEVSGKAYLN